MDGLRSINYSETGTQPPYVIKDIKDPPNNNDKTIGLQFNKRIDDTARIAQMLVKKPGLKWIGNQALLDNANLQRKAKAAADKKRGQQGGATNAGVALAAAGAAAAQVAKVVGSTLAQVPVNGTGTHFVRGFTPDTYLKQGDPNGILGFLGFDGENGASKAKLGKKIIPDGSPQTGLESFPVPDNPTISTAVENDPNQLGLGDISKNTYSEINTTDDPFVSQDSDYIQSNYSTKERQESAKQGNTIIPDNDGRAGYNEFGIAAESQLRDRTSEARISANINTGTTQKSTKFGIDPSIYTDPEISAKNDIIVDNPGGDGEYINTERSTKLVDYRKLGNKGYRSNTYTLDYFDPKIRRETRVGLGDQGRKKTITSSYSDTDPLSIDTINALAPKDEKAKGTAIGEESSRDFIKFNFQVITPDTTKFLYFRAFLTQFDDSFNGSWDTTKYLGRAENFYTYQGFERNINIGFIISAATREEMKPLYQKMAYLASSTAPTYGNDGKFMRGSLVKVTVGDYIYEVPGILESVNYTWDTQYTWEIAMQNPEGNADGDMQELPHTMNCALSFKPIHSFVPETGLLPYITNPTPGENKTPFIVNA